MIIFRCRNNTQIICLNRFMHELLNRRTEGRHQIGDTISRCRFVCRPSYLEIRSSLSSYMFNASINFESQTKLRNKLSITYLPCRYAKGTPAKGKIIKPKVHLTEEVLNEVINYDALKEQMQHVLDKLKADYVNILTVRNSGSIETLPVTIEGDVFPLNEIAQIFRKNPQLVVINMSNFQEGQLAVMEALQKSGMNINPQQDGTMIYIPLPKVTREHRQKLSVSAKAMFNKAKENLRDIQNKFTRQAQSHDELSKDLVFNTGEHIRFMCDNHVLEAEKLLKTKDKELLGEDGLK